MERPLDERRVADVRRPRVPGDRREGDGGDQGEGGGERGGDGGEDVRRGDDHGAVLSHRFEHVNDYAHGRALAVYIRRRVSLHTARDDSKLRVLSTS